MSSDVYIYITVFVSVPLGDPIVCLTVVTVSNEARAPMNTEKITSPTTNQTMANIFAGTDLGQRSPYLQRNDKRKSLKCDALVPSSIAFRRVFLILLNFFGGYSIDTYTRFPCQKNASIFGE